MKEALIIIIKMWKEERPSFKGRYYSIREAVCTPKPIKTTPANMDWWRGRKAS
ncbi:MAG: hypothetical protein ACUVTL_11140 [Thermoproteota archaeon]